MLLIIAGGLAMFPCAISAQVSNLMVNGSTNPFLMTTGDSISWGYDISSGSSALVEIWLDLNHNGFIDPSVDILYHIFTQTDGQSSSKDGPGDMDGLTNGHVFFGMKVGLAPGTYVMRVSQDKGGLNITGTVNALASPAHTISGHVSVPGGYSSHYFQIEMKNEAAGMKTSWDAFTDANGDYSIGMDTTINPNQWRVKLNNYYPLKLVPMRTDTSFIIVGNHTGINFTLAAPAAQVAGFIHDESGNLLVGWGVHLWSGTGGANHDGKTNGAGFYQIGVLPSEVSSGEFNVETGINTDFTTDVMTSRKTISAIHTDDSLRCDLVVYSTNAIISGQVLISGAPPHMQMAVLAASGDTMQAVAEVDSATGDFTVPVSTRSNNYTLSPMNFGPNLQWSSVVAHPGNSGVQINLQPMSVMERQPGVPAGFRLEQNYPNPFNPSTSILFSIAHSRFVNLTIYDMLGREVKTLVSQPMNPGYYSVTIDAAGMASGVYVYRLNAGTSTDAKRMTIVK